jgi:hypothetical protein
MVVGPGGNAGVLVLNASTLAEALQRGRATRTIL